MGGGEARAPACPPFPPPLAVSSLLFRVEDGTSLYEV